MKVSENWLLSWEVGDHEISPCEIKGQHFDFVFPLAPGEGINFFFLRNEGINLAKEKVM